MTTAFESLINGMMYDHSSHMKRLRSLAKDMNEFESGSDFAYNFEWMEGAFERAARCKVLELVIKYVWKNIDSMDPHNLNNALREYCTTAALDVASSEHKSTSATANKMHRAYVAVWADLARAFSHE